MIVAFTAQIVMVASWIANGKPVPFNCKPNPPLLPPDVIFKLVRVSGKTKGNTVGALDTIPI
jgi:hypothetical protein